MRGVSSGDGSTEISGWLASVLVVGRISRTVPPDMALASTCQLAFPPRHAGTPPTWGTGDGAGSTGTGRGSRTAPFCSPSAGRDGWRGVSRCCRARVVPRASSGVAMGRRPERAQSVAPAPPGPPPGLRPPGLHTLHEHTILEVWDTRALAVVFRSRLNVPRKCRSIMHGLPHGDCSIRGSERIDHQPSLSDNLPRRFTASEPADASHDALVLEILHQIHRTATSTSTSGSLHSCAACLPCMVICSSPGPHCCWSD